MARFPRIEIADIPGRGQGVITLEDIHRGTLIISEEPCMTFPRSFLSLPHAIAQLERSPEFIAHRDFYMSLPCSDGDNPIQGRFKHFLPLVGNEELQAGLFPFICKCNHICHSPVSKPNATWFWADNLGRELLHATVDIRKGEEILASYTTVDSDVDLRKKWDFDCTCAGCLRSANEKRISAERLAVYRTFVEEVPFRFQDGHAPKILNDIEAQTLIACEEGHVEEIGSRCYDAFQLCAMYGDADSATKWITVSVDQARIYQGEQSDNVIPETRLASKPQEFRQWAALGRKKLRGPNKSLLAYAYPPSRLPVAPAMVDSTRAGNDTSATLEKPKLSKGQKKLARAKAKKVAAKAEQVREGVEDGA